MENALVSILIPNYNHSQYLEQCIESALGQTYSNCEIIVLDNSSSDESVKIAMKFTKSSVKLCRNQFNALNISYRILTEQLAHGKYFVLLCADDYIYPGFVEKAVKIMEDNSNVGYVHCERTFITEANARIKQEPFFKCSFVAPGKNTMPIYMLTTVAHPSQGLVRMEAFRRIEGYDKQIDHMNADRTLWFYLSNYYDYAYIREELCAIRLGNQTETFTTLLNFQHPILCHLTIKDFVRFAKDNNIPQVYEREEEALKKLSFEFLDYAKRIITVQNYELTKAYLKYAVIVNRGIAREELYKELEVVVNNRERNIDNYLDYVDALRDKKRNYDPPQGYINLGA